MVLPTNTGGEKHEVYGVALGVYGVGRPRGDGGNGDRWQRWPEVVRNLRTEEKQWTLKRVLRYNVNYTFCFL